MSYPGHILSFLDSLVAVAVIVLFWIGLVALPYIYCACLVKQMIFNNQNGLVRKAYRCDLPYVGE